MSLKGKSTGVLSSRTVVDLEDNSRQNLLQGCSLGLERLGLETVSRRFFGTSRLGLEDITSRSRSCDFSLVNIHAMHQVCGYITKKIMDLTRKKQVIK